MKFLKSVFKGILLILGLAIVLLYIFDYDYILKGVRVVYLTGHTTAFIDDAKYFDNRLIEAENPQDWPKHKLYNQATPTTTLNEINDRLGTIAYVIIKNDSIWYEDYAESYSDTSKTNSFSMAKSITVTLLGKAIRDGFITSLDQPVADFFPKFNTDLGKEMTVGDLASMSSGLNWDESYSSPFSLTARSYYDTNIRDVILGLNVVEKPGESYKYLSGNTQLLGMVIEKATNQTLTDYLQESFWTPMESFEDATWQLDSEDSGMEKSYCCIASNAKDFARFGKLYKDKGAWNGEQLLDSSFVSTAIEPRFKDSPEYGYGFWLSNHLGKDIFAMRGILGQYVITIPEDNVIIVRLGHKRGQFVDKPFTQDFYTYIEEAYSMMAEH